MAMADARIVARGVDTLLLNAYYTDERGQPIKRSLDDALALRLDGWKKEAQEVHDDVPTSLVFNHKMLHMCPNGGGRGQWPWMLKSRDLTLYVSPGQWNGIATVRLSSEYLWSAGSLVEVLVAVQVFVDELFHEELYLQVSEVHLCADIAGWQEIDHLDRRENFVSRSRKRTRYAVPEWGYEAEVADYAYGLQQTGFDFSRGGPVAVSIYDKTREIRQSGKEWFADIWCHNGWSEVDGGKVWRVELRLRREALHELRQENAAHEVAFWGVEDAYELPDLLPVLWAYGVGSPGGVDGVPDGWLRCVLPGNDQKRSRWVTHPVWEVVQGAFLAEMAVPEQLGGLVRKRHEQHSINKGIEAVMGYLTSLAAWAGGELVDTTVDLSVVLHWLMTRGDDYLERVGRDFAAEVQRKRVRFGLQAR
jgi:hypothetical protein